MAVLGQHIFQNIFYDNNTVAPNWAFDVYISVPFGNGIDDAMETDLSNAVQSVKIPQRQIGVYTTMFKGLQFDIPTRYENTGTVEIKFSEDNKLTIYNHLVNSIFNRSFNAINYFDSGEDGFSNYVNAAGEQCTYADSVNTYWCVDKPFSCHVGVYSPLSKNKSYFKTFSFYDCYCESISEINLDYSKTDDIVEYTCVFRYNRMNVDDNVFMEVKQDTLDKIEKQKQAAEEEPAAT